MNLRASIRIRNSPSTLEHDVILHERPPDPVSLGLSAAARLEMLTEQLDGPTPSSRGKFIHRESDPAKRAAMAAPDFLDADVNFGGMKMGAGKAFSTTKRTNGTSLLPSPVGKMFTTISQRKILIEAVEHRHAVRALEQLPAAANLHGMTNAAMRYSSNASVAHLNRPLPTLAKNSGSAANGERVASIRPVQGQMRENNDRLIASTAAESAQEAPAFILDYQLVSNAGVTNFTARGNMTYLVSAAVPLYGTVTIEGGTVLKFTDDAGLFLQPGAVLICDTTNYLPAVFTAKNDNTVGETIAGSSGSPNRVYSLGLGFDGGSYEVSHVRFNHLFVPLFGDNNANITARHVQFLDADMAIYSAGAATLNVFNALVYNCDNLYYGDTPTFRGEHITMHHGQTLGVTFYPSNSTMLLRNSLLVDVPSAYVYAGPVTTNQVIQLGSDAGTFQTVEGGAHYLPINSPYRGIAVTNIDSSLRSSLAEMTTYQPTLLTGTPTNDLTLLPVLPRDVETLGYHYPAVDYIMKNLTLQNTTLTLRGGVVLASAFSSDYDTCLWLSPGRFITIGTPARMNRLIRANQVQENAQPRGWAMVSDGFHDEIRPELTLRFTEISSLAGSWYSLFGGYDFFRFELSHCTLFNGYFDAKHYGGIYQSSGFSNNLFRSVTFQIECTSPASVSAYNNTFKDGAVSLSGAHTGWRVKFNIFDHAIVSGDTSQSSANENAYVGLTHALNEDGYVELQTLAYAPGPLGRFYLAGNTLQNLGSANASALGLYHFTTRTNQAKEGASSIDYGFHYAAVTLLPDGAMEAVDTDLDGIADYAEDLNGDGLTTGNEFNFTLRDTNADGTDDDIDADTEPPIIRITSPLPFLTSQPLVQLLGNANERLPKITYKVYDASGVLTASGTGFLLDEHFDERRHTFTTNWFQCFDVPLKPGVNSVVVSGEDRGGNKTIVTNRYDLDFSIDQLPPAFTLAVPNGGTFIAKGYNLHGHVDDPSADVQVHVTAANGASYDVQQSTERTGDFIIENLSLETGMNTVTVTARDAAGNSSLGQILTIEQTAIEFTIDSVAPPGGSLVNISGGFSDPNYTVWIGGVKAVHGSGNSSGTYTVVNAIVAEGGVLNAIAIPNADNGGNGAGGGSGANPTSAAGINKNLLLVEPPRHRDQKLQVGCNVHPPRQ
jgi:hypothetical protein